MRHLARTLFVLLLIIICFALPEPVFGQKTQFTVVIDPGHGGKDPGAVGATSKEKDIVLAVGKKLGDLIKSSHSDVKVLYTRDTDKFVELNKRAEIGNKAHADLFISIHCNALDRRRTSPQGVETFVLGLHRSNDNLEVAKSENSVILYEQDYSTKYQGFNPNEPESYIMFEFMADQYLQQSVSFATIVQNRLVNNSKRVNRNVRQAGFLVLREVAMPSVLVELGYISNPTDEKFMKSANGQASLANSIYLAFKDYKREYDKKNNLLTSSTSSSNRVSQADVVSNEEVNVLDNVEVLYKIQFLTSPRKLSENASQLKGLNAVSYYVDGKTYKYTCGDTSNWNEINNTLRAVRKRFKDAFIVEFVGDKRVK